MYCALPMVAVRSGRMREIDEQAFSRVSPLAIHKQIEANEMASLLTTFIFAEVAGEP
jgi:hypothetical protein